MSQDQTLIVGEVRNQVGHLTINRPEAYNALNLEMIRAIAQLLQRWATDDNVVAVVLRANGDKAFCAGGDIRQLYEGIQSNDPELMAFFKEEYALDLFIHNYPKPVMALANGLVLGGGMGLFQGAAFRVITEKTKLGMPEVGIGFFPDVGGSYFLSRLAGELGTYLAVTGNMLNTADALYTSLADFFVKAEQLAELDRCLDQMSWQQSAHESLRNLIETLASPAPDNGELASARSAIDQYFAANDVKDIANALAQVQGAEQAWAEQTLATLRSRSAMAMAGALKQIRTGKTLSLADCFNLELHLIPNWLKTGEFSEGVRALIVDKDKNPAWKYRAIEDVEAAQIEDLFAGFRPQELGA